MEALSPGGKLPGIDPRQVDLDPAGVDAELDQGRPRRRWWSWLTSEFAARWTARVLALIIWQVAGGLFDRIPTPASTISFLVDQAKDGNLLSPILVTLHSAGVALVIVLVAGVLLGSVMGRFWSVRYFFTDLVIVGVALPAFIWALLGVMWFGFNSSTAPIFVCVVSATPMLIISTREGAMAVDTSLRKMSDAYQVPLMRQFRSLILPTMAEYIFAGFRIAVLAGWGAILLVEWFGSNSGIGYQAQYWYEANNFTGMMAWGVVMLVVIVAIDRLVMEPALRRSRRWRAREDQAWS
jgi:ABC-type nitrate/sulfonate/bicarbonate transport system permease component